MSAESTVRAFVDRINCHDVSGIVLLCTRDHVFTDSLGATTAGAEELTRAWQGYFRLFPDYHASVESLAVARNVVLLSGWASGSLSGQKARWRTPAAWRAEVSGNLVSRWQVYADNKPVYDILARDA